MQESAASEAATDQSATNEVAGDQVAADQVASDQVAGDQVAGDQVAVGQVAGDRVTVSQVAGQPGESAGAAPKPIVVPAAHPVKPAAPQPAAVGSASAKNEPEPVDSKVEQSTDSQESAETPDADSPVPVAEPPKTADVSKTADVPMTQSPQVESPGTESAADSPTNAPAADSPKTESPKAEPPKAEPSKSESVESSTTEPPKTESLKAQPLKPDAAKPESAKTESLKAESLKTETAKTESLKAESLKVEELGSTQEFDVVRDLAAAKYVAGEEKESKGGPDKTAPVAAPQVESADPRKNGAEAMPAARDDVRLRIDELADRPDGAEDRSENEDAPPKPLQWARTLAFVAAIVETVGVVVAAGGVVLLGLIGAAPLFLLQLSGILVVSLVVPWAQSWLARRAAGGANGARWGAVVLSWLVLAAMVVLAIFGSGAVVAAIGLIVVNLALLVFLQFHPTTNRYLKPAGKRPVGKKTGRSTR